MISTVQTKTGNMIEVDKANLQGSLMSWWSLSDCPCLLGDEKDTMKEIGVVNFLNQLDKGKT
jgi:hypothetical protein